MIKCWCYLKYLFWQFFISLQRKSVTLKCTGGTYFRSRIFLNLIDITFFSLYFVICYKIWKDKPIPKGTIFGILMQNNFQWSENRISSTLSCVAHKFRGAIKALSIRCLSFVFHWIVSCVRFCILGRRPEFLNESCDCHYHCHYFMY